MSAFARGGAIVVARLAGSRRAAGAAAVGAMLLAATFAAAERSLEARGAVGRALQGTALGLLMPLLVSWLAGHVLDGRSLAGACEPWARFGLSRRALAAGFAAALVAVALLPGAAIGVVATSLAHGAAGPTLAAELASAAWIGALGAAAYAAVAAAGATMGATGRGRYALLTVDFASGASTGALAAITPRGHVRALLGGPPPLHLAPSASVAALVAIVVLGVAFAALRTRP